MNSHMVYTWIENKLSLPYIAIPVKRCLYRKSVLHINSKKLEVWYSRDNTLVVDKDAFAKRTKLSIPNTKNESVLVISAKDPRTGLAAKGTKLVLRILIAAQKRSITF